MQNMNDPTEPDELSTAMTPDPSESSVSEAAALVALDALDDRERPAAERNVDAATLYGLHQVTSALAIGASEAPPADLRDTVLAAARARRPPGRVVGAPIPATPVDAFRRTVDELHDLLTELNDAEWGMRSLPSYGRTRDLAAHLVGVEENLLGVLGEGQPPDPVAWNDHVRATAPFVSELSTQPTTAVVGRWARSARRLADLAAAADPDDPISVNDVPTTVDGMFVLRTFEVWTHHEDVCRATGRSLPTLDAPRLRLMSTRLVDALAAALTVQGNHRPGRTARLVLTGKGGGTFDTAMSLGETAGRPDVTIVADVVDFCRVASRRIDPPELDATIEGNEDLAELVLQAAGAFARD